MQQGYAGLLIPILFLVIFYFIVIRPQQKKDKKIREMRNNLKVGDEIVTIGGIHGKITKIKDDIITIEVGADKTKFTISKWAVGNLKNESEEK
ncbi:preprotein translocase subunit YajC [Caldisalinibacter kiritimatiensis]|uniref:Preprotein translocase subunit YajC n=1 Tax=Caldisalinibacter kiritimatiensis TaxID=1304284 RepID=R1CVJ8_9FIRM|nr:preprotein translocase subunit YajC [Caldisalinibacter kiritimatiensis]EOD00669.1 Preprotein translocase subunit YajC [Caldisalinibacter kiritimatiensis]